MKRNLRWLGFFMLLTSLVFVASGCNTFRGIGEDFKAAGRAIQRAVK